MFNDIFSGDDDKFQVGLNYVQADRNPLLENESRVGVTLSTQINEKITINGKLGVPVGGSEESVIVGDVELQLRLNEDGTLKARVFNRENDINYIGEGIGYTQGVGITYQVDFDTFKELVRKILNKAEEEKNNNPTDQLPDSDLSPEFIKFINDKRERKTESPKKDAQRVPEID